MRMIGAFNYRYQQKEQNFPTPSSYLVPQHIHTTAVAAVTVIVLSVVANSLKPHVYAFALDTLSILYSVSYEILHFKKL